MGGNEMEAFKIHDMVTGEGISGITKINELHDALDKVVEVVESVEERKISFNEAVDRICVTAPIGVTMIAYEKLKERMGA
jgi:hypothetical protein